MSLSNKEIAAVLEEIGVLLVLTGENPFKTRAYERAAREIERCSERVADLASSGGLGRINGVGKGLQEKIVELVRDGRIAEHEDLKARVPAGLFDMLKIPGLGPKRVKLIYEERGIASVAELEYAAKHNNLQDLPGLGKKSEQSILDGIEMLKRHQGRFLSSDAAPLAEALLAAVRGANGVQRADLAGSLRRGRETVKDIDILAAAEDAKAVRDAFTGFDGVERITADGETKISVVLRNGMAADLRLLPLETYGAALQHFTGSKDHNVKIRALAKKQGLKSSEWGLFKDDVLMPCETEEAVYGQLGLAWIPPSLREDSGEIEAAAEGGLPDLIEAGDIRGILHVHTTWSDGSESIEAMAEACRDRGYAYLAICDHSESAAYANGLSADRLKAQGDAILKVNDQFKGFRVLRGIEADIRKDGTVDYDDRLLEGLDLVIASVHSSFRLPREEMTKRILRAIENPHVDGIGHPTGRLLLGREPYEVDLEALIEAAKAHGKFLELNADPHRLDLAWPWLKAAKAQGVKICINPDAHSIPGFDNMRYGIAEARRGWLTKHDVLNTGAWWG